MADGGLDEQRYTMRAPCKWCGHEHGRIVTRSGQDTVRCLSCDRHVYNAPKTETGRKQRTLTTVHNGIKPKQRARVLEKDNGRCVTCGSRGGDAGLHVGHLLSVKDGLSQGLTEAELNHDENLAAMCAECNVGWGERTVPLKIMVAILRARIAYAEMEDE